MLIGAIIFGHSELIHDIFNTLKEPPIPALLRIALFSFPNFPFSWLLERLTLSAVEFKNLLLFIAKTQSLPDEALSRNSSIEKIESQFNHVFESDDIQTIIACVHIPGSNLSSSV
jgi:hypothetical protein